MTNPTADEELVRLRELLAKASEPPWFIAERPTKSGLLQIEDGREHGMFPVTGEGHEIRLTVAAVNALPSLLARIESLNALIEEARRELERHFGPGAAATLRSLSEGNRRVED